MKKRSKKVFIRINACLRRSLDASKLIRYFQLNGYAFTVKPEEADFIFFVSCAAYRSKEEDCFRLINELSAFSGELIVLGCLPAIAPTKFAQTFNGRFLTTKDLYRIDEFFPDFGIKFEDIPDTHIPYERVRSQMSMPFLRQCLSRVKIRTSNLIRGLDANRRRVPWWDRAFLRISYGCPANCAYCAIRKAVGKFRSKPLSDCLRQYKEIIDHGYRDIQMIANNVGAYGLDIQSSFGELMMELSKIDEGCNISWEELELNPRWAIKYRAELLRVIKEGKIKAFMCPIQSGSERILGLMNRYDTTDDIATTLTEFKETNPNLILSTHVIVGFPTETDDDFCATLDLLGKIDFDNIVLFPYYDGEGTIASRMDNKVHDGKICDRVRFAVRTLEEQKMILLKDGMRNVTAPTDGLSDEEIMKVIFLSMAKA